MAGSTPSLGEIIDISRNPGGVISDRPKMDFGQLTQTVNEAAERKAKYDWAKYNSFLGDLKDVYKDLGEIEGLQVAQADQAGLKKRAADIFDKISADPQKFFGGGMKDVEKEIGALRSDANRSVQDRVFDEANRGYLQKEPTLQTPENKALIENYFKQPLGSRKQYMLNLPSLFSGQTVGSIINPMVQHGFSTTGLSPDGKFISTTSGIKYDEGKYKDLANQLYQSPDPKTGRTFGEEAARALNERPQWMQDYYKQKNPQDPVKAFYDDQVLPWRKPEEIDKTELKEDPFALEALKNREKLNQQAIQFGYDKVLEAMRIGGQKEVAKFREELKNKTQKQKTGALNGIVDSQVNDALLNAKPVYDYNTKQPVHELNRDPATLKIFGYSKGSGTDKEFVIPDNIMVTQDGKKVRVSFYKKDDNGNTILAANGNPAIDEQHTAYFGIDEYKARFGKDILGVNATEKEINADSDDNSDDGTSNSSSSTTTVTKTKIPGF